MPQTIKKISGAGRQAQQAKALSFKAEQQAKGKFGGVQAAQQEATGQGAVSVERIRTDEDVLRAAEGKKRAEARSLAQEQTTGNLQSNAVNELLSKPEITKNLEPGEMTFLQKIAAKISGLGAKAGGFESIPLVSPQENIQQQIAGGIGLIGTAGLEGIAGKGIKAAPKAAQTAEEVLKTSDKFFQGAKRFDAAGNVITDKAVLEKFYNFEAGVFPKYSTAKEAERLAKETLDIYKGSNIAGRQIGGWVQNIRNHKLIATSLGLTPAALFGILSFIRSYSATLTADASAKRVTAFDAVIDAAKKTQNVELFEEALQGRQAAKNKFNEIASNTLWYEYAVSKAGRISAADAAALNNQVNIQDKVDRLIFSQAVNKTSPEETLKAIDQYEKDSLLAVDLKYKPLIAAEDDPAGKKQLSSEYSKASLKVKNDISDLRLQYLRGQITPEELSEQVFSNL